MLFPETRKSTRHVTEFLTEVKMMTVMDHPRVVEFIGVSWNNLMDLCVVTEFMAGGDLRAWLGDRADNDSPVGFDFTKVKIATHVVHALAYLHSLTPSVIHRDLKSRNILLSENQDAKLADFAEPVRHAKDKNPTGRKMPETAILQLVAMGKLRVEFSPGALKGIVQLGTACTAIDPTERPSAAEAFRKLQTILAQRPRKQPTRNEPIRRGTLTVLGEF
ncbi:Protein kinase-like domain [Phytophthora cactorum]|nr:Protein kinase-like domain [Phytophthora cactorum]